MGMRNTALARPGSAAMIAGGCWKVVDGQGQEIGRVNGDEFIRCGAQLLYRMQGPELYSMQAPNKLLAFIEGRQVRTPQGRVFLQFLAD
jgi:hypothetical protein